MKYDHCVIGAGIVGLATALALLEREPGARLLVLEKEPGPGRHQTGHNSGVIHSGIYYAPGSLKARLCREGCDETKRFARENGVPFLECGKLIVATNPLELSRLEALNKRAAENGVEVDWLGEDELARAEPNVTGLAALRVAATGIIDYRKVCEAIVARLTAQGAKVHFGAPVRAIRETPTGVSVQTQGGSHTAQRLVVCGGLQADRLARMAGLAPDLRIVPFRGEYFRLDTRHNRVVDHLIYPVPDPDLPFLGIHLTRMIDGSVTVGPNAVLGLHREGYGGRFTVRLADAASALSFPGLWRLILLNWRATLTEARNSAFRQYYLQECRKYCPELGLSDLRPYPAGIRAQVVLRDGTMLHDFMFSETERMTHVLNAPSPAATAAIPIGRAIAARIHGAPA